MHESTATVPTSMKIGFSHGYRIEGDMALLNVELANTAHAPAGRDARGASHQERWALQLWACDQPHAGGPLFGIKVAEAPIELPQALAGEPHQLHAEAFAHLPLDRRDYAMVLVLASQTGSASEQVHDYANYPARQPFAAPHLEGAVGYEVEGGEVVLRTASVVNPRAAGNLSGSLALELRALTNAGSPDDLAGQVMAHAALGRLEGQATLPGVVLRATFAEPPAGQWPMALVLVEFTAEGFVARDSFRFPIAAAPAPAPVAIAVAASELAVKPAPVSIDAAAPKPAPMPAPAPVATAATLGEPGRVSIQTASVDELAEVPGITRKLAIEIVKARPFRSVDELVKTRGVGDKLLRKLRDLLTV